ncbi:hypothetical protein [uncultured Methanolobus sp.]|uniref:hypothetical protein n=1 Tax=uncultured Methanolobus sp. TaxID=218300 RepID=UPI002AAC3BA3|nr:hypothetical protein [uncultured Methanolobus sp.]
MDVDYGQGGAKVFIPSDSGSNNVDSMVNINDRLLIFGAVSEYEGELEVVVDSSSDVIVV